MKLDLSSLGLILSDLEEELGLPWPYSFNLLNPVTAAFTGLKVGRKQVVNAKKHEASY